MRKMANDAKTIAKSAALVAVVLWVLSKVQVHANVAGASCSASVLALIAVVVGLLVLAGVALIGYIVIREFRAGVYRPKHA